MRGRGDGERAASAIMEAIAGHCKCTWQQLRSGCAHHVDGQPEDQLHDLRSHVGTGKDGWLATFKRESDQRKKCFEVRRGASAHAKAPFFVRTMLKATCTTPACVNWYVSSRHSCRVGCSRPRGRRRGVAWASVKGGGRERFGARVCHCDLHAEILAGGEGRDDHEVRPLGSTDWGVGAERGDALFDEDPVNEDAQLERRDKDDEDGPVAPEVVEKVDLFAGSADDIAVRDQRPR